jgi:hypothetical protein
VFAAELAHLLFSAIYHDFGLFCDRWRYFKLFQTSLATPNLPFARAMLFSAISP